MHCLQCKKAYHAKCANLKERVDHYVCDKCTLVKQKESEKDIEFNGSTPVKRKKHNEEVISQPEVVATYVPTVNTPQPPASIPNNLQSQSMINRTQYLKSMRSQLMLLSDASTLTRVLNLNPVPTAPKVVAGGRKKAVGRGAKSKNALLDGKVPPVAPQLDISIGAIHETPSFISMPLTDYQIEGVNTLTRWFERGIGGILADEM
jgi:hypothetical protein